MEPKASQPQKKSHPTSQNPPSQHLPNLTYLVRIISLGAQTSRLLIPLRNYREIEYQYSLVNLPKILENFFKEKDYFLINFQKIKETLLVLQETYLTQIQAISKFFKLHETTVLLITFLILKHSSLVSINFQFYNLDLLLGYIVIAWKFNETQPIVIWHFVQTIYQEDVLRLGLDWL